MLGVEYKNNTIYEIWKDELRTITDFEPYFYYYDPTGKYRSIYGKPLSKKTVGQPSDIRDAKDAYPMHHEADINYANRYIIDRYEKLPKSEYRIGYVDIEVDYRNKEFPNPSEAKFPISVIGCKNSESQIHTTFILCNSKGNGVYEKKFDNHRRYYFYDEKEMLYRFIEYIKTFNFNIITGWNLDQFDMPYIMNRMNRLKIDINALSPLHYSTIRTNPRTGQLECKISGRIIFDLLTAMRKITAGERASYKLNAIAKSEIGEEKLDYNGSLEDLYQNDLEKYVEYNVQDVELLEKINNKMGIINLFDEIRRLSHCQFNDVLSSVRKHDCALLRIAKSRGVVFNSKQRNTKESSIGAFVVKPKAGIHKNVAVADFKSLYPSIIRTFNLSPETKLQSKKESAINIDDKYFFDNNTIGILPERVKQMSDLRVKYKRLRNEHNPGTTQYSIYESTQNACKVNINDLFGAAGNPYARFYDYDVFQCIMYVGQRILKRAIDYLRARNIIIIYGDTDSVFIQTHDRTLQEIELIISDLNQEIAKFVQSFGVRENYIELEFEKLYSSIKFNKNKQDKETKKRYIGILNYKDGKAVDMMDYKGIEARRSDYPVSIQQFQIRLYEMILKQYTSSDIITYIKRFKREFSTLREEIGKSSSYKSEGVQKNGKLIEQAHIRAVRLANTYHQANIQLNEKIMWFYVNEIPQEIKKQLSSEDIKHFDVIAISAGAKLYLGYGIDYEKMWKTLAQNLVDTALQGTGIRLDGQTTLL